MNSGGLGRAAPSKDMFDHTEDGAALSHGPDLKDRAEEASAFLKALAHEARLMILCMLIDGERSVGELEVALDMRQPAVSQQLARLRADNLVEARRDGKNIFYSVNRSEVREVITALNRAFCRVP
jgi:DNA-binding transcriptional ArsR family regulator